MRRTRIVSVAAISVLALALSACGSSEEAPPPAATPTPSASPVAASPTADIPAGPVMPAAAREHTEAGAEAFVEYFWEVVNYAQATGDTKGLRTLGSLGCNGCEAGANGIERVYANEGHMEGGDGDPSVTTGELLGAGDALFARVRSTVSFSSQVNVYPNRRTRSDGSKSKFTFMLSAEGDRWSVVQLEGTPA